MYQTKYIYHKGSWGIVIYMTVDIISLPVDCEKYYKITDKIYLKNSQWHTSDGYTIKTLDEDIIYIIKGINLVKDKLLEYIRNGILIDIINCEFSICDFQEEGFTMAIMKLLSEVYGFDMPNVDITFDKAKNKYLFDFKE